MDSSDRERIAGNLAAARGRIAAACRRAGRSPDDVTVVAVTKTVAAEVVRIACDLGVTDVGENRVQEASAKIGSLADLPLRWHMIGHVQSNKAKPAAELFHMVQSVDTLDIAERLSRRVAARGGPLPVLLEVNIAGEDAKFGFRGDLLLVMERLAALPGLNIQGLMTVAPLAAEPEAVRGYFRGLRALRDELSVLYPHLAWRHLSMGMTDDFEVAIEEGATMVRLGRAIFGPRTAQV